MADRARRRNRRDRSDSASQLRRVVCGELTGADSLRLGAGAQPERRQRRGRSAGAAGSRRQVRRAWRRLLDEQLRVLGNRAPVDRRGGNLDAADQHESSRAAVTAGAGIKRSLGHSLGLRFDVGATVAKAPTFGLPYSSDSANASVLPINSRVTNFHASVGIVLYLWRSE